jgi:hypothetical protein
MPPVRNWFDPRNRAAASEYGDDLPTEPMAPAPEELPVAQGDIYTLRNRRLADALAEQGLTEYRGPEQAEQPVQAVQPQGLTEGERAHQELMEMERRRQQAEAASLVRTLWERYQALRGRK